MPSNIAWGIDIGNRALKAVRVVNDGGQLRVDDFEVIEHENMLSNAGDNRESLISSAISSFIERHEIRNIPVAVGVSGTSSFARFIKLPPVEDKKLPQIVQFEAQQQIPFPLEDVEWSYQLFRTEDSPDVEVGIFAMRKEPLNRHLKFFTDQGLNVEVVQMNPLAVYNGMYADGRINDTTMIIDLGAENADLVITDQDSVWLRTINIGGNAFTEALMKAFKLSFAKAEELKRTAATTRYAKQIFQAMRPTFADLVAEVQRSIGFYASVHRDSRIARVIAQGGTFKLPALQKYLQQNLQLKVEKLDTVSTAGPRDAKLAASFNENVLSLGGAYGLATQALGKGAINSSLLPEPIRRTRMWKEKTKWFAAAAALFVLGTILGYASIFTATAQYDAKDEIRSDYKKTYRTASNLDRQWSSIESAGDTERNRIKAAQDLLDYRYLWPSLTSDLANAIPDPQEQVKEMLRLDPTNADQKKRIDELAKQIPRGKRELLFIESWSSLYKSELGQLLQLSEADFRNLANELGGSGGGPRRFDRFEAAGFQSQQQATGDQKRGFLVLVRGVSPNDNALDLLKKYEDELKKISLEKLDPDKRYYVARTSIVKVNRFSQNQTRINDLQRRYNALKEKDAKLAGNRNRGGGDGFGRDDRFERFERFEGRPPFNPGRTNPQTPNVDEEAAFKDARTGELVLRDWEFQVLIAIVVDAKKAPSRPQD